MTTETTETNMTIVRSRLAQAVSAREQAAGAAGPDASNAAWLLFDGAVDELLEALTLAETSGMLGLFERFERLGVSAGALPAEVA